MNKQMILDAISQALDGMGMDTGDQDEYGESEMMEGNEVPVWSKLQAGTLGQGSGAIHDKSALMLGADRTSKPPMTDNYGMPASGDQEEMMTALGII